MFVLGTQSLYGSRGERDVPAIADRQSRNLYSCLEVNSCSLAIAADRLLSLVNSAGELFGSVNS